MNFKIILMCSQKIMILEFLLELYLIYKLNKELTSLQYRASARELGLHFHLPKFAFMFLSNAVKCVTHRYHPVLVHVIPKCFMFSIAKWDFSYYIFQLIITVI